MMNELISVIIPAYNAEKYLDGCCKSLADQTYKICEFIVINDGSTDKSGEIANHWAKADERFRVIHQQNLGVSAARNKGLDVAAGSFIGFADADDEIYPDMFEFLHRNLLKHNADISHCAFEWVKENETVQFHNTGALLVHDKVAALKDLLAGSRFEPSACTKLYKKDVLKTVRFAADLKINEDLLFNVESFGNADVIVFEDVVKYRYNYNPRSASRATNPLQISTEVFKTAKRTRKKLIELGFADIAEKFYFAKVLTCLKTLKEKRLYSTEIAKEIRRDLKLNSTKNLGLRLSVLKNLLTRFHFAFNSFYYFYNLLFAGKKKWR